MSIIFFDLLNPPLKCLKTCRHAINWWIFIVAWYTVVNKDKNSSEVENSHKFISRNTLDVHFHSIRILFYFFFTCDIVWIFWTNSENFIQLNTSLFCSFSGKYLLLNGYGPYLNINFGNYDIQFDNECTAHWNNQSVLNAQYA